MGLILEISHTLTMKHEQWRMFHRQSETRYHRALITLHFPPLQTVLDDCTFLEVSCSSWLRAFKSTQLSRGAPTRSVGGGGGGTGGGGGSSAVWAPAWLLEAARGGGDASGAPPFAATSEDTLEELPLLTVTAPGRRRAPPAADNALRACQSSAFLTATPY